MKNSKKKGLCKAFFFMALFAVLWNGRPLFVQAENEKELVVVIDPGHGGDNLGAEFEEYTEKDMTLTVARAMKEELEKYDHVKVYLTREDDRSMSIKDRAQFAADIQADFLFCLHFNMSVNHNLFGAEVWVPAFGDYYIKGRQFAEIEMQELTSKGLYSRGIKTKLNDRGENYYGILRFCTQMQVPSALVEHCHLDHEKDQPFYQNGEEQLKELGRIDALAAAKYLGLKSDRTGEDYSGYEKAEIPYQDVWKPDSSEPEECSIEIMVQEVDPASIELRITAYDSDSYIQYYDYSLNGGESYSSLMEWPRSPWNRSEKEMTVTLEVPRNRDAQLICRAYNGFDKFTESNRILLPAIKEETKEDPVTEAGNETAGAVEAKTDAQTGMEEPLNADENNKLTQSVDKKREIISFSVEKKDIPLTQKDKLVMLSAILLFSILFVAMLYLLISMIIKLKSCNKRNKRK